MWTRILRLLKHSWLDQTDTLKAIPDEMAERLAQRVAASESRHTGEIRLCAEASLPISYVLQGKTAAQLQALIRERALSWFGRLGVWDTANNNGVLVYLLLAEHSIEIVADRGLTQSVDKAQWQAMVDRLGHRLHEGDFEAGLTEALEEVSMLLVTYFPIPEGGVRPNELNNAVLRV